MIHPACAKIFRDLVGAILTRGEMDEASFHVMETTGVEWKYVRRSIDYAMSEQNKVVQDLMQELLDCEIPIYKEELKRRGGQT